MNDNHAPPASDNASWEASCAKTAEFIGRKFAEHRERMKVTPLARMPSGYWDRRRALKDKRMDIE